MSFADVVCESYTRGIHTQYSSIRGGNARKRGQMDPYQLAKDLRQRMSSQSSHRLFVPYDKVTNVAIFHQRYHHPLHCKHSTCMGCRATSRRNERKKGKKKGKINKSSHSR